MNKSELRKYLRSIELDKDYITKASEIINSKVINSDRFLNARSIFCYVSTTNEVQTNKIIEAALADNKALYVPKCIDDLDMAMVRITSLNDLKEGKFGILEPVSNEFYQGDIDLTIVPCLACCIDGKRIGHGLGYYDRFLKDNSTYKVALCFDKMLQADLEVEEHDQLMDEVVSE